MTEKTEILRIKRKRLDDPIHTLVVDNYVLGKRLKKDSEESIAAKPNKIFKLVDTLEGDTESINELRDVVSRLTEQRAAKASIKETLSSTVETRKHDMLTQKLKESSNARYKVTERNRQLSDLPFKIFEAVKEEEDPTLAPDYNYGIPKVKKASAIKMEEDVLMCNFVPMVREYLKISDDTKATASSTTSPSPTKRKEEEEYVYDIYHIHHPIDSEDESGPAVNVASVTWVEDDNLFMEEDSETGDSDEDSNAEDYWKNEYPDEEEFFSDDDGGRYEGSSDGEY